jgi:hypothetical protein
MSKSIVERGFSRKPKPIDDEYINKLEVMMEKRKQIEVTQFR